MDDPAQTKPPAAEYRKTPVLPDAELGFLNRNVHIGFIQPLDKLEFVRMRAAQYLPPGGRCPSAHTGADEERRSVPNLYAFR